MKWRAAFTFAPSFFLDTWTPSFFGIGAFLQNFSSMRNDTIVGSWARCLAFYLFGAFWAVFGYAGNWGVFWGFFITLFLCPMLLALSFLDKENDNTQVDMIHYLAMLGLTNEAPEQKEDNPGSGVRGPALNSEPQQMAYPVVNVEENDPPASGDPVAA